MKAIALLALLAIVAPRDLAGTTIRDGEVRGVSVVPAPGGGKVEIVIDLQGTAKVHDFTLTNPARLVIDLQGARLMAPATLYDGKNRGGVRNVRYAQFKPDVVRVVIDLDVLKDYQVERTGGEVRVRIGTERTGFAAWSSRRASPPNTPAVRTAERAPAVTSGPATAARVTTPTVGRSVSIEEYLAAHRAEAAQSQAPRITVQWDNASIEDVVAGFAAFSGRTIILGKGITGNVTAEVKNQPWDLALYAVLESQGLAVQTLPGGILNVVSKVELARADSTVPITTRLVRINYAKATSLVPSVQSIVTKRGQVVADSTSNSLVITEVSSRIDEVVEFVRGLDLRTPQVSIQAKIIFVDRQDVEEPGVKYDLGSQNHFFNRLIQRPDPRTAEPVDTDLDGVPDALVPTGNFPANENIVALDDYLHGGPTHDPRQEPWEDSGCRVFITHLWKYREDAVAFKTALESWGVDSFVAHRDINPGAEWVRVITAALHSCDALVALLHNDFKKSDWCDQEVGVALGRRIPVIPVNVDMNPHGLLGSLQALRWRQTEDDPAATLAENLVDLLIADRRTHDRTVEALVQRLATARSYEEANRTSSKLSSAKASLSTDQIKRLVAAVDANRQVREAWKANGFIDRLARALQPVVSESYGPDEAPF